MVMLTIDPITWSGLTAHRAMAGDLFVNYSSPSDLKDRIKRRKVSSYIGLHYRNRSRPSAKKAEKEQAEALAARRPEIVSRQSGTALRRRRGSVVADARFELLRDGHGVRSDPFATWPIEYRSSIPSAVDYYLHFYAPSHSIRPELSDFEAGNATIQAHFRHAMQSPLLFETIIALSRANLTIDTWSNHQPDTQTLQHYGVALSRLRSLVATSDLKSTTEDTVLFAIVALMNIDFLCDDMTAFQAHLAGLRHIITLRGGIETLGWPTLLAPAITSLELFWTYICSDPAFLPPDTAIIVPPRPATLPSVPASPFSTTSRALPPAFHTLTLTHRLSVPTLHLLRLATHYDIHLHHVSPSPSLGPTTLTPQLSVHLTRDARPIPPSSPLLTSPAGAPQLNASNQSVTDVAMGLLAALPRNEKGRGRRGRTNGVERLLAIAVLGVCLDVTKAERGAGWVRRVVRGWVGEVERGVVGDGDGDGGSDSEDEEEEEDGENAGEDGNEARQRMRRAETDLWAWVALNLASASFLDGEKLQAFHLGKEAVGRRPRGEDGVGDRSSVEASLLSRRGRSQGLVLLKDEWRVRLVRRVVEHFEWEGEANGGGKGGKGGGLEELEEVPERLLTGYIWTDGCREAIRRGWKAVWEDMVEERASRQTEL